jgi:hypothetical protein
VLHTIVSGDKALSSKLLHRRFRAMREEQHIPIAVSHVEDIRFPCERRRKALREEVKEERVRVKYADERRKTGG